MRAANNDIVELLAHGQLYWVTRKRFEEIETVSRMLGTAISRGASLSTVQHILMSPELISQDDNLATEGHLCQCCPSLVSPAHGRFRRINPR